jgi:hypothetical protein
MGNVNGDFSHEICLLMTIDGSSQSKKKQRSSPKMVGSV